MILWKDFEAAAPEIARLGRERFERKNLAVLATLRKDGSPRISPVEPFFVLGHLLLGLLQSQKALDLLRDPRCAVNSVVSDRDGSEGEFKLHGRAVEIRDQETRQGYLEAFLERWKERPPDPFPSYVFSIDIESAAAIDWDTGQGIMIVKRWSPKLGFQETRLKYP